MAILTLLLGVILLALGFGGLLLSVNLIPTEMGMLYAVSGVIFLGAAGVVAAIAALISKLDRIVAPQPKPKVPSEPAPPPTLDVPEDEVNVNRSGHLPSLRAIEEAIAAPEGAPKVVGHYKAGGARYMIFSDGAIEAETDQGAFRFGSMAEFKAYIAGRPTQSPQS